MPIFKDGDNKIQYTPPSNGDRLTKTGVAEDDDFAICDKDNVLKQIKFNANPTTANPGSVTIKVDIDSTDSVFDLGTVATLDSFKIIQPDFGTSPTASTASDTLTLTSSDGSVDITGNAGTKTIDFTLDAAIPTEKFELEAFLSFSNPSYYKKFTYTGSDLTKIELFDTPLMTTLLFKKDFTYSGGDLTTLLTTRISPANTLTKTFAYSGGDLANITAVYV